jgi:hypothetical protein
MKSTLAALILLSAFIPSLTLAAGRRRAPAFDDARWSSSEWMEFRGGLVQGTGATDAFVRKSRRVLAEEARRRIDASRKKR